MRSQTWVLDPTQQMGRDICETVSEAPKAADDRPAPSAGNEPIPARSGGLVRAAVEATRGGAETMYPEYRKKMGKPRTRRRRLRALLRLRPGRARLQPPVGLRSMAKCDHRYLAAIADSRRRRCGRGPTAADDCDNVPIEVLPVQGNMYMLAGAGGNITVQVGRDGVLMVDTASGAAAPQDHGARSASCRPARFATSSIPTCIRITWAATRRSRS